jgi:hypothetical protein
MRDRTDSLTGSEHGVIVHMSEGEAESDDGGGAAAYDDDDDPYAWLSKTAPASPGRRRITLTVLFCWLGFN